MFNDSSQSNKSRNWVQQNFPFQEFDVHNRTDLSVLKPLEIFGNCFPKGDPYYNPDADFNIYSFYRSVSDGSQIFLLDVCEKALANLLTGKFFCDQQTLDKNGSGKISKLEHGDIIYFSESGDGYSLKNKKLKTRYTAIVPMRTERI